MTEDNDKTETLATVAKESDTDTRIDALEQLVRTLVADNEQLNDKIESLESIVVTQAQEVETLRENVDDLEDDLLNQRFHSEERLASVLKRVTKLEQSLEADVDYRIEARLSPVERYLIWGPEVTETNNTATVRRAATLVKHFADWAVTSGDGRPRILSKPNKEAPLRARMRDACGESLEWVQIYRAMDKAADLSDGKLIYEQNDRFGHMLTLAEGEDWPITTEESLREVEAKVSDDSQYDDQ
ncbi:DUF3450 domain-containing protein [Haloarcula brevis]|uniref:hypothetical protein n=1 Tax=Haloarcula brevis TaxID=3111453 RepID=UPI00300F05DA